MNEELFIVGDVQGCHQELLDLLDAARFDPARHQLAFVGDLINRGPDSAGVLAVARRARRARRRRQPRGRRSSRAFAGETMDRVRAQLGSELDATIAWIRTWPTFLRFEALSLIVVHAGIAPGKRPEECTRAELTRIRAVDGKPWFDSWRGPETVVFGHWAKLGKVDRPLAKGLDTGCVYGGRLTGIFWPRAEWVSVPARQQWFDPIEHVARW